MKIVVCVKQVPYIGEARFDAVAGRMGRRGVTNVLNAFDRPAVVAAVDLARAAGGEVLALTLGPPEARAALSEALAFGADRAIHVADPAFEGADTGVTAHALAAAIRRSGGADLILLGQQSTDAATSLIGPRLAELLGRPLVASVEAIEPGAGGQRWRIEQSIAAGGAIVEIDLPAVLTASERLRPPAPLAAAARAAAADKSIATWSAGDLWPAATPDRAESRTRVVGARPRAIDRVVERRDATDPPAAAGWLAEALIARGIFGADPGHGTAPEFGAVEDRTPARPAPVIVWLTPDVPEPEAWAALALAREIATGFAGRPARSGVRAYRLPAGTGLGPVGPAWLDLIAGRCRTARPAALVFDSSAAGRELAGRLAARLGAGVVTDCRGARPGPSGRPIYERRTPGGDAIVAIEVQSTPALITLQPGLRRADFAAGGDVPPVVAVAAADIPAGSRADPAVRLVSPADPAARMALDRLRWAGVVIGVGTGVGGPEHLGPVRDLAQLLDAPIAATRKVTDRGWLPRTAQVGLTGSTIEPRFYLAIGVRGLTHHAVGIRPAGAIVAINSDPDAPIWRLADLGLIGDWRAILPPLIAALRPAAKFPNNQSFRDCQAATP